MILVNGGIGSEIKSLLNLPKTDQICMVISAGKEHQMVFMEKE